MLSINTLLNSVAMYKCDSNHYFEVGSKTSRICRESGEWSTEDIHCCEHCQAFCMCVPRYAFQVMDNGRYIVGRYRGLHGSCLSCQNNVQPL